MSKGKVKTLTDSMLNRLCQLYGSYQVIEVKGKKVKKFVSLSIEDLEEIAVSRGFKKPKKDKKQALVLFLTGSDPEESLTLKKVNGQSSTNLKNDKDPIELKFKDYREMKAFAKNAGMKVTNKTKKLDVLEFLRGLEEEE